MNFAHSLAAIGGGSQAFSDLTHQFTWSGLWVFLVPYLTSIVIALLIFFIGKKVARWISNFLVKVVNRVSNDEILSSFVGQFAFFGFMVFVILAALTQLGVDSTSFIAVLGAAGLAVGLALQGMLQNFAAGLMIMVFKPFSKGHFVEVGGVSGSVKRMGLLLLELETPDNRTILLPNGKVFGGEIVNYHMKDTRRIDMVMDVAYGADILKAKQVCEKIVLGDERVLSTPAPTIAVGELAASSIRILVRPWVRTEHYWTVKWDLTEAIYNALCEANIEIPFNQLDINLRQIPSEIQGVQGVTVATMEGSKPETASSEGLKDA